MYLQCHDLQRNFVSKVGFRKFRHFSILKIEIHRFEKSKIQIYEQFLYLVKFCVQFCRKPSCVDSLLFDRAAAAIYPYNIAVCELE